MRTYSLLVFSFCLFFPLLSLAQQAKKVRYQQQLEEANEYLKNSNFNQAIEVYTEMLEDNPTDTIAILKLGEINFRLHNLSESNKWYEQVLQKPLPAGTTIEAHHIYNYAEILLIKERVDEAMYWYEMYGQAQPQDSRTARKIDGIKRINEFKNPSPLYRHEIASFNSAFDDFSPAFYNNGLVFVSGRKESIENKEIKDSEYLDLYFTAYAAKEGFLKPVKFSESVNTSLHEGPVVFFDGHRKMIFTRNIVTRKKSSEESVVLHLQLFSSTKDSTKTDWTNPQPLSINNQNYSMGHPAINSTGSHLYFSANIPGGIGGTDLYVSEIINGDWGPPRNLGDIINTEGNEMFPFIYQDSVLYFASDGHSGIGGLDIYKTPLNGGTINNMGHPINSPQDDFALILNDSIGYFSTSRNSTETTKNDDIYQLTKVKPKAPEIALTKSEPIDSVATEEVYYTVQILALRNANTVQRKFLKDLKGVLKHDGKDGFHRYTYGKYKTPEEAVEMLREIRSKGFDDAFIRREKTYITLSKREGVDVEILYQDAKK